LPGQEYQRLKNSALGKCADAVVAVPVKNAILILAKRMIVAGGQDAYEKTLLEI
jgi:hypothetical protein